MTYRSILALFAALLLPLAALADEGWASRDYEFANRQLNDFMSRHQRDLVDPVARSVRKNRPGATAAKAAPFVVPAGSAHVAAAMASAYPERDRRTMEKVFGDLLAGYGQIEQRFGIPRRDLAGAVAAFVAGCYMGYRNTPFPDAHFAPLVAQLRGVIAAEPAYAAASPAARQEMYERMAILGMFMANAQMALARQPDPAAAERVRLAAKGYLEQFLKTDAERVAITADGLTIR